MTVFNHAALSRSPQGDRNRLRRRISPMHIPGFAIFAALFFVLNAPLTMGGESRLRLEYSGDETPRWLLFSGLIGAYIIDTDLPGFDPVQDIFMKINSQQTEEGWWMQSLPEEAQYDRAYAEEVLEYLKSLHTEFEEHNRRAWEVVACSDYRGRPVGEDVFVVMDVLGDTRRQYWEVLRQRAERGPYAEAIHKLIEQGGSMTMKSFYNDSLRFGIAELPDTKLDAICDRVHSDD